MSWSRSRQQQKANIRAASHAALPRHQRLTIGYRFLTEGPSVSLRTTRGTRAPNPTSARSCSKSGLSRADNDHIEDRTPTEN